MGALCQGTKLDRISVLELSTGRIEGELKDEEWGEIHCYATALHPHRPWLATAPYCGRVRVWDYARRALLHTLELIDGTERVLFTRGGLYAWASSNSGGLQELLFDLETGEALFEGDDEGEELDPSRLVPLEVPEGVALYHTRWDLDGGLEVWALGADAPARRYTPERSLAGHVYPRDSPAPALRGLLVEAAGAEVLDLVDGARLDHFPHLLGNRPRRHSYRFASGGDYLFAEERGYDGLVLRDVRAGRWLRWSPGAPLIRLADGGAGRFFGLDDIGRLWRITP